MTRLGADGTAHVGTGWRGHGIGPLGAASILGHSGDIYRFPTSGHFARYTGTAPIAASSGPKQHHRLNPRGNRQLNRTLPTGCFVALTTTPSQTGFDLVWPRSRGPAFRHDP
jgi:transposase